MSNQGKNRKSLIIGIVAAVVILAAILVLLLTQCTGSQPDQTQPTTAPGAATESTEPAGTYELYWNADRAEYAGKSEAGMSSREPESDGYFHVRFILDGKEVTLKVENRQVINSIDVKDVMGLEFDENGIVVGIIDLDELPLEKIGWQFYVQSTAKGKIKLNSAETMNGMEVLIDIDEDAGVYDMSGLTGPKGTVCEPVKMDRVYAIANGDGKITHVFIYDRPYYMLTHEAPCEHCKETVTWYEWTREHDMPVTTGHYQLMTDIQLRAQPNQAEDSKICLDLNGKRVDSAVNLRAYAMFYPGTELAIMDTSEGQTGVIASSGRGDQGMVVWARYGALHLYGGTLDGSKATSKMFGTVIEVPRGAFFYMHGGRIIGGTAETQRNETTGKFTNGLGGAVCVSGKMVMNDGMIEGGYAKAYLHYPDGKASWALGCAGNIFISSSGYVEINGGTVKNGVAEGAGGNFYLDGTAELVINGGIISNGAVTAPSHNGGNIFAGPKAKITQNGGSVLYGTTSNCGGNVYHNGLYVMNGGVIAEGRYRDPKTGKINENIASANVFNVNGKFNMYGGFVNGRVNAIDTSATDNADTQVLLSGYAKIYGDEECTSNLVLSHNGGNVTVLVGTLRKGARIGVTSTTGYFSRPTKAENAQYFFSDIEGADIVYHDGRLGQGRVQCICGANSEKLEDHVGKCKAAGGKLTVFAGWYNGTTMPSVSGQYYLTCDFEVKNTATLKTNGDGKNTVLNMDLNGKQVVAGGVPGSRLFSLFEGTADSKEEHCELTVCDSVGTAKVTLVTRNASSDQGILFWGRYSDSVIDIYGGTYDGSAIYTTKHSGVIISTDGELNMYGGTISGGSSVNGGIVAVGGTGVFNMYEGVIENGKASNMGGNVLVVSPGVMNMYGGIIRGGSVNADGTAAGDIGYGGNVSMGGTLNMYGGEITNGLLKKGTSGGGLGGNVYVSGTANLMGGKIANGTAEVGGNVGTNSASAQLVFDGVQVIDGVANSNGGNIAINVRGNKGVTIKGNTLISGGKATSYGGNIFSSPFLTTDVGTPVEIIGATIQNGSATDGGNIYFTNKTITTISDSFISNGTAKTNGGNIVLAGGAQLNMTNTDLVGGSAAQAGSLYAGSNSVVTLKDLDITGGKSTVYSGNVYVGTTGSLTVENVKISGGTTTGTIGGGNIYVDNVFVATNSTIESGAATKSNAGNLGLGSKAKVTLTNVTISDGKAVNGANIYINGGTLTTTGGAVKNGAASDKGANLTAAGGGKATMTGTNFVGGSSNVSGNIYTGSNAVITLKNLSVTGGTSKAHAGSVYVAGSANLTIDNVVLDGGKSNSPTYGGGNVFVEGGTFTATNSTIKNGSALNGANLYGYGASKLTLTNTTITGGNATGAGGGIHLTNTASLVINGGSIVNNGAQNISAAGTNILQIKDGTIGGGVDCNATTSLKLSGAPVIDKTKSTTNAPAYGLNLAGKAIADVSGMTGGDVHVYGIEGLFTGAVAESFKNYFSSDVEGKNVVYTAAGLSLGQASQPEEPEQTEICICGGKAKDMKNHTCEAVTWTAWESTTSLPTAAGNYYLTADVNLNEQTVISGQKVNIDLRGKNINFTVPVRKDGYRMIRAEQGAAVSITDSTAFTGTVTVTIPDFSTAAADVQTAMKAGNSGMLFWVWADSSITIFDGIYNATDIDVTNSYSTVCVEAGGTFNVYGGTINPSKFSGKTNTTIGCIGVGGTMNMYGGTISGGTASYGGNIALVGGKFNMYGGTVSNGKAANDRGGNIFMNGASSLVMEGGTISGGTATYGGNIAMADTAAITLKGGEIKGGVATSHGGNIQMWGKTLTVEGGTISGGSAKYGGNVSSTAACTIDIKSGSVTGGTASDQGGNIYSKGGTKVKLINGTVSNGTATGRGGNIYFENANDKLTVSGGTLKDGKGSEGGNVFMKGGADMDVTGGTISGGTSTGTGGSIYLYANSVLTITGGTISGGTGTQGGNIFNNTGLVIVEGGTIVDGKATYGANICNPAGSTLEVKGGVIGGGVFGNASATIKLSGTVQIDKELSTVRKPSYSLYYNNTALQNIGTLNAGSRIVVLIDNPAKNRITGVVPSGYENYFFSDATGNKATFTADGLTID